MIRQPVLLAIDTETRRVRRYEFVFDKTRAVAEFELPNPQPLTAVMLQALEMARKMPMMPEQVFT